jgi:hypothetical protein
MTLAPRRQGPRSAASRYMTLEYPWKMPLLILRNPLLCFT